MGYLFVLFSIMSTICQNVKGVAFSTAFLFSMEVH